MTQQVYFSIADVQPYKQLNAEFKQLTFYSNLYKKERPEQKLHFLIIITVHYFRIPDKLTLVSLLPHKFMCLTLY
jgi:hypothetical protein